MTEVGVGVIPRGLLLCFSIYVSFTRCHHPQAFKKSNGLSLTKYREESTGKKNPIVEASTSMFSTVTNCRCACVRACVRAWLLDGNCHQCGRAAPFKSAPLPFFFPFPLRKADFARFSLKSVLQWRRE